MKGFITALALAVFFVAGPAFADDYAIDGSHAAAVFKINHLGISTTHGRFNKIEGSFSNTQGKETLSVTIDATSIDTASAKRDTHLRGPDFFNVKQFPTLTFKSKSWKKTGDKTFDVTGDLTLHGVTKTITVPVVKVGEGKDPWGGHRAGYDTTFTIARADFGMNFMPGGIGATVEITIALEGIKKK